VILVVLAAGVVSVFNGMGPVPSESASNSVPADGSAVVSEQPAPSARPRVYVCADGTRSNQPCSKRKEYQDARTPTTSTPACPAPYTYQASDGLCHNLALERALDDLAEADANLAEINQRGIEQCGQQGLERSNLIERGINNGYYDGDAGQISLSIDVAESQRSFDECLARYR
jgi:hypothetical protein